MGDLAGIGGNSSIDFGIATLAARQYGNASRQQLLALGLSRHEIQHRIQAGRLHQVHLGVYSVGRPPRPGPELAAAAVLACGADAALSHGSAMALWGLWKRWPAPPHVTVRSDRRRPGIKIHRCRGLTRRDLTRHLGIAVTSPARTLLDVAPELADRSLARAVNEARLSNRLRLDALADAARRFPCHPGAARLAPFVEQPSNPTRSEFEDAFIAFCKRFKLPRPEVNATVLGHEVDALFAQQKLIVELDGYRFHSSRASFERDRERDADALVGGYGTVRLTWERMITTPGREASRLRAILSARS